MFDAHGKVISRTEYNHSGKPRSTHEFERDGAGKVLKESDYGLTAWNGRKQSTLLKSQTILTMQKAG